MSGTVSLFQKYRSQSFDDLVGQEVVVRTLTNALNNGNIAHVYLFCGPRGTGKTSTARILAKALNCEKGPCAEPCNQCASCLSIQNGSNTDIMEIDGATYTSVDIVRSEIIDKVQYAPALSRYKVYIIDEVHKLSTSACSALLKVLEEPPEHVIFILATTDPHKILPTVLSRCQRHDFQRFTLAQMSSRIKYVCEQEGVTIDDEAADMVAQAGDGSLRDALSELGAIIAYSDGHIGVDVVSARLGLAGSSATRRLVDLLLERNVAEAIHTIAEFFESGRDMRAYASELCEYLRRLMLISANAVDNSYLGMADYDYHALRDQAKKFNLRLIMAWLGEILNLQSALAKTLDMRILWEMSVVRLTCPGDDDSLRSLSVRLDRLEAALKSGNLALPSSGSSNASLPSSNAPDYGARFNSGKAPQPTRSSYSRDNNAVASPKSVEARTAASTERKPSPEELLKRSRAQLAASNGGSAKEKLASAAPRTAPVDSSSQERAKTSPEQSKTDNLGWGEVGASVGVPAPKSAPSAKSSSMAERALAGKHENQSRNVASSWGETAASPKAEVSAEESSSLEKESDLGRMATAAELSNLRNFWLDFIEYVKAGPHRDLCALLAQGRSFKIEGKCFCVAVPSKYAQDIDSLMDNAGDINKLMHSYRANFEMVRFDAVDFGGDRGGNAPNYEGFVKSVKDMFGAEVVAG